MTVTANDIANEALQLIGNNMPAVAGQAPNFDNSPAGVALQKCYGDAVAAVFAQHNWNFARNCVSLSLSGNPAPLGWQYEYIFPGFVDTWQLAPAAIPDQNNKLPINMTVGNALVGGTQTRVIWTNLQNAVAVYNNAPTEPTWPPAFRQAVVRFLASELALAIPGRPDTAQSYLESGSAFENIAEMRGE